ncbi:MAG: DNA-3-methyladenine glycosylase I [Anaerolineales bacterium]
MPSGTPPEQIQPGSLNDYLEVMSKAVFQSGMPWRVVEAKWSGTREAFHDFDVAQVAAFDERDIDALTKDTRVIRNYRKLNAIVSNAQTMIALDEQHGSFKNYLRSQTDFDATLNTIRNDFKFMGPTGIYYFLYVVGEQVPPHDQFEATYRK